MKNNTKKYFFIFYIILIIFSSCVSVPKEGKYKDYTYEQIIKKHGTAKYDNIYVVDNNFELSFIDPNYALYFTNEELENGIQIRKLVWENIFNHRLLIWLKIVNEQWVAFDSLEYNSTFVAF
jgi:hypothetical protein